MGGLPQWARNLVDLYESNAANQFLLHGNVDDSLVLPRQEGSKPGRLEEFLVEVLLPGFDIVLSYDLGNGIRVLKGEKTFRKWPSYEKRQPLPRSPHDALNLFTHYFRYCANLRQLNAEVTRVAVILKSSHLILPANQSGIHYDLSAMALLVREWASETRLIEHPLASFLVTENLNDLHPLLVNHLRTARIRIPLPSAGEIRKFLELCRPEYPVALRNHEGQPDKFAAHFMGATLSSIAGLLKRQEHKGEPIGGRQLTALKKSLVEKDCNGLIEFIESQRDLDAVHGHEGVKQWVRQDIALWRENDLSAMPMGYLLCGPVGTGKTFLVECLAGEAGVPVVKFGNFRDRWVGSTESNLEKIFRLLHALGRCVVFIDEADQAMGKRSGQSGDSGVSGRVYSMMAEEMSDTRNRGKILWILASSRPDLIEVDLKRPGRIDVKFPLFPTSEPEAAYRLLRALCGKHRLDLPETAPVSVEGIIPKNLTPGAAESLAVRIYRQAKTRKIPATRALGECLRDYQNPVPHDIMEFQIRLAVREASDLSFVPKEFL